jgi:hypothetical protein
MSLVEESGALLSAEGRRTKSYRGGLLTLSLWAFLTASLAIPSLFVRAVVLLAIGVLIYLEEDRLGLFVPASPGFLFWCGSYLSYVVGGLGTALLLDAWEDYGIRHLAVALPYLGIGFAAYYLGLRIVGGVVREGAPIEANTKDLTIGPRSAVLIALLFVVPVIARSLIHLDWVSLLYSNILIGALQSIEQLPILLMAIYVTQPRVRGWVAITLFVSAFAIPFQGMILGHGRNKLLLATFSFLVAWLSLQHLAGKKLSLKVRLLFIALSLVGVVYFGVISRYRQETRLDPTLTTEERLAILKHSTLALLYGSDDVVGQTLGPLLSRLVERPSLELLNWAHTGEVERVGWSMEDIRQLLFSWVPKALFPTKGQGYRRDIMEYYGFTSGRASAPATVLTDAARRSGMMGVIFVYFLMGVASTLLALKVSRRGTSLAVLLAFYFALLHIALYSTDVLSIFLIYIYRFPSSTLVICVILWFTGILPSLPVPKFVTKVLQNVN